MAAGVALRQIMTGQARRLRRVVYSLFAKDSGRTPQNSVKSRNFRSEEGAEIVEFAFAATALFVFFFGVIELGIVLFMQNTAAEVARDTSRWASVRGSDCANPPITDGTCTTGVGTTKAQIEAYAQADLPGASGMTVTPTWYTASGTATSTDPGAGGSVKVVVSYTFASVPFISSSGLTVTSTSQSVIW